MAVTYLSTKSLGAVIALASALLSGCADQDRMETKVDRAGRDRHLELGRMYLDEKRFDDASRLFGLAIERDSLHALSHFYRGLARLQLKQFTEAQGDFARSIRMDSTYIPAYHNLAVAYLEQGKYRQSTTSLEAAIRVDSGSVAVHRFLGFLYQQQHKLERAEGSLRRAVSLDERDAETWESLGKLHRQQGRHADAVQALEYAVALSPQRSELYKELWNVHLVAQEYDRAERVLRKAVAIDSTFTEAYRDLGDLLQAVGQEAAAAVATSRFEQLLKLEEDISLFETGLKEMPDNVEARYALAVSYEGLGRTGDAMQAYAGVLKRDSRHAMALDRLSRLQLRQGNVETAGRLARELIALHKGGSLEYRAHFTLGYVLASGGKLAEARQAFEVGLVGVPDNSMARFNLGNIHLQSGNFQAAAEAFAEVVRLDPTIALAYMGLGQAEERNGRAAAARAAYESFLTTDTATDAQLEFARVRLAEITP